MVFQVAHYEALPGLSKTIACQNEFSRRSIRSQAAALRLALGTLPRCAAAMPRLARLPAYYKGQGHASGGAITASLTIRDWRSNWIFFVCKKAKTNKE